MDNLGNTAIGKEAMWRATEAEGNVGVGNRALYNLNNGKYNIAIGDDALDDVVNQSYQIQIGQIRFSLEDDPDLAIRLSKALREALSIATKIDFV